MYKRQAEDIVQEVLLAAFKKLKEGQQVEELDRYIIRSVSKDVYKRQVVSLGGCRMIAMMPATHAAQIHGKIRKVRWLTKLLDVYKRQLNPKVESMV